MCIEEDVKTYLLQYVLGEKEKLLLRNADKIYLDHCTILHHTQDTDNNSNIKLFCEHCKDVKFNVDLLLVGISDKAMAFKVELHGVPCANDCPHITIATFNGGKPVDSNYITKWKPIYKTKIITTLKRIDYEKDNNRNS